MTTQSTIRDLLELTKPRVTSMVMVTAAAGCYLAATGSVDLSLLIHTVLGTGLMAAGTAVLNQFLESEADGKMRRTMSRPLPSGRVRLSFALWYGLLLLTLGTLQLFVFANWLTALLGLITSAVYLLLYTPMKTRTASCTLVGALPGAAPPVMGWVAVRGELDLHALILFTILFGWQFPHFLAIAWMYRDDYKKGGFRMLPNSPHGARWVGFLVIGFSCFLFFVSLMPAMSGLTGFFYLWGAIILGLFFLWFGKDLAIGPTVASARRLVRASIIYLPLLLTLMIFDKA
jgi:protoheme IX farnesyltransferase